VKAIVNTVYLPALILMALLAWYLLDKYMPSEPHCSVGCDICLQAPAEGEDATQLLQYALEHYEGMICFSNGEYHLKSVAPVR